MFGWEGWIEEFPPAQKRRADLTRVTMDGELPS